MTISRCEAALCIHSRLTLARAMCTSSDTIIDNGTREVSEVPSSWLSSVVPKRMELSCSLCKTLLSADKRRRRLLTERAAGQLDNTCKAYHRHHSRTLRRPVTLKLTCAVNVRSRSIPMTKCNQKQTLLSMKYRITFPCSDLQPESDPVLVSSKKHLNHQIPSLGIRNTNKKMSNQSQHFPLYIDCYSRQTRKCDSSCRRLAC